MIDLQLIVGDFATSGGEGSNNIVAYGTAAGGDIDSDFWIVIVDNTPPVIVADWVVNPSYKNYKVDPNIFVGEYVNLSYVGSDAHWYRVFVPASGMTSTLHLSSAPSAISRSVTKRSLYPAKEVPS